MSFVHLHRHSEHSLLDGTGTADQYAQRAAELGQPALALTDHGNLCGALHHIKACKNVGIMPIVGVEAYFKPDRGMKDKEHKECWHLVLLARNLRGWRNLLRITSEAYTTGFYHKPCVDWDLLQRYGEGLFCATACFKGYLPWTVQNGTDRQATKTMEQLLKIFGDNLAVELMPHDFDSQRLLNSSLVNMANEKGVPYIATVDAHYPYAEWADTQDVMLMMATGQTLEKRKAKRERGEDVYQFDCDSLYLMSAEEVGQTFAAHHPDLPQPVWQQAIDNTIKIVQENFSYFAVDTTTKLPKIAEDGEEVERIIDTWCEEGLVRIGKHEDPTYRERLNYELGVLKSKGVLDYFVLVGDLVRAAKSRGIRVGAGRGSAAGCLVSYLVGITTIDPLAHGLLFERFLNPDRKGLPDIDIDFQDDRREEVKQYLAEKWGADHVRDIVAFSTFKPRAAIQDVARVLDVPANEVISVTNTLEIKPTDDADLSDLRAASQELDAFALQYPEVWKHAMRIEGQIRTVSKHAAGVVITPEPVENYMPIMRDTKGGMVTAWSDAASFPIISDFGFVKIDVLATDGLTRQQHAIDMVKQRTGEEIDLDALPVAADPDAVDERVMAAFTAGLTLGVFQFGSRGITGLLRQIQPTSLRDISAANALYRPGPLQGGMAQAYGRRKNGSEPVTYFHDVFEPILNETYGLLIYQEQVMQICHEIGGLTLAQADDMRKAIGKEYRKGAAAVRESMGRYFEQFVEGCRSIGMKDAVIDDVWEKIVAFGGYGFNKSHSVAYGLQAYHDMYLKVHYPMEFYAALLSHLPANPDKAKLIRKESVREARVAGVQILPPDINESERGFTVIPDKHCIRYGLGAVKYLGDTGVKEIMDKRPFYSYDDFEERVEKRKCNKRAKEALMGAGAFDLFGKREGWDRRTIVEQEREQLGVSLTATQDLNTYREEILSVIHPPEEIEAMGLNEGVTIGGEFIRIKRIRTKKGDQMAFALVAFGTYSWDVTIFPQIYEEFYPFMEEGSPIIIKGRKDDRGIIVDYCCSVRDLVAVLQEAA